MDVKDVTKQRGLDIAVKEYCFDYGVGTYVNSICR